MIALPKRIFVTGIDTNIGKTVISAILCEALKADYWKPVQSGSVEGTDSDFVRRHCFENIVIHPSAYCFKEPVSPHLAAKKENTRIEPDKIKIPQTKNTLVIEGAGGIMVPLNDESVILDLIVDWETPAIVVSKNYLGSINHTILTCEMLNAAGVEISGIIFNGEPTPSSEEYILNYTNLPMLGRIEQTEKVERKFIQTQAEKLRKQLEMF
ncbi:MAG: dethiobiotin synthase [Chitinophagales bacterium]|nr:dethiobiotin synthase [Chitinophagales bacterium]